MCLLVLSITHRLIFGVLLDSNTCSFGKCLLSVDHGPRQSSVSSLGGKRSGLEVINDYSGFFVRPTSHRSGASVLLVPLAGCPFSLHPPSLCSCTSCSLFFLVMRGRRRIWGLSTHLAASAAACCIHRKEWEGGREGGSSSPEKQVSEVQEERIERSGDISAALCFSRLFHAVGLPHGP